MIFPHNLEPELFQSLISDQPVCEQAATSIARSGHASLVTPDGGKQACKINYCPPLLAGIIIAQVLLSV